MRVGASTLMDKKLLPVTTDEVLDHVQEECAEVILAIAKLRRFGPDPHEYAGVAYDNLNALRDEIADLGEALTRVRRQVLFPLYRRRVQS